MISVNLQKAIDALSIQDVYLRSSQATWLEDFDPKHSPEFETFSVQQLQFVKQTQVAEIEGGGFLARVFLSMGARWVDPKEELSVEPKVYALIEAEFIAEYFMQIDLDQPCLDEFALNNTIIHVWPYWREYLASQCDRMRIPRLILPTFQLAHYRNSSVDAIPQ